ncbi:MAG: OstA family protein [Candidatus Liberibacter solanacearum]
MKISDKIYTLLFVVVFVLLKTDLSRAESSYFSSFKIGRDQEIYIHSDTLDVQDDLKKASFRGGVTVTQGDTNMQAEEIILHYTDSSDQLSRMDMRNNVIINSDKNKAMAKNGYCDFQKKILVLYGDKVIFQEGMNTFLGCRLTVKLDVGTAYLQGCGSQQVKSIIKYNKNHGY